MLLNKKLYICFCKPEANIMKTKKTSPKKAKSKVLQPDSIQSTNTETKPQAAIVRLSNMRTGRVVRMGVKAASMLSDKYPKEFKIL